MSSPLSILVKTVVTVGLISGVARVAYLNSNTKAAIQSTEQNIRVLKGETNRRQNTKLKKKVSVSQYQKATKVGKTVADALNQILSNPKTQQQGVDYHSPAAKTVDKFDNYNNHRFLLTIPFAVSGYHVQFAHSGADASDNIECGFMFYDQHNQLQGILKCKFNPETSRFSGYHMVMTKQAQDANQTALRALANRMEKAQNTKGGAK